VAERPAVKICGVCSAADAALATAAGAVYIGVILAPGRPRTRTLEEAAAIFAATTSQRVGVFVDPTRAAVDAAVAALRLDVVQLHGDEDAEFAASIAAAGVRVWKAVRVRTPGDVAAAGGTYGTAVAGLLLDGWSAAGHGGVGARFDWAAAAPARRALPPQLELIVAGGLGPNNVAHVTTLLRPDVVDVSSGVESELCRKSAERVQAFIAAAHGAAD
jgi:phosphoribosylanthranilate isomerase